MSDNETKAIALRTQAMACLQEAETLDGLKPFVVTHTYKYGITTYVLWAQSEPTEAQIVAGLDCEFEPESGDSLDVDGNLKLQEMTGVWPSPRNR